MKTIKINEIVIGEGKPKVCVPITGSTAEEIAEEVQQIKEFEIDLVEWRADFFGKVDELSEVLDVLEKLKYRLGRIPVLFTLRSKKEGGEKEFTDELYVKLNEAAINSGLIELVDIELEQKNITKLITEAKNAQVVTVISSHDFHQTPPKKEIFSKLKRTETLGGDIFKIAVMPQSPKDVLSLLEATWEMKSELADRPIITMAMGPQGVISRLSGELFGSAVTFGAAVKASAPGQLDVKELQYILKALHHHLQA